MVRDNKHKISNLSIPEALSSLKTTISGINTDEVVNRQKKYGFNTIKKSRNNFIIILARQFNNAIIYLLFIAAVLAFVTGGMMDGYLILSILILNAFLGFIQEYRSECAAKKLAALVKNHVLVRRDESETIVSQDQLVPGDIIILKEGDIVPADCRIISCEDFKTNESLLTGESTMVTKQSKPSKDNDKTIVYAGSIIEEGEALLVVFATGDNTKLGKIAQLSSSTRRITQYERSLQSFSSLLIKSCLILIPAIFIIKILIMRDYSNLTDNLIFMFAFAIAVVPEAFPVIVTVALSSGALRLAKQSAVVKKLSAIEDIGNVTVLCTDKTGTLTQNKLTIKGIISDQPEWMQILAYASLDFIDAKRKRMASSYDIAFEQYIPHDLEFRAKQLRKVKELPFNTDARRRRIILQDTTSNKHYLVEIGSAETLLEISTHPNRDNYLKQIINDGKKGIRHLGLAVKEVSLVNDFKILQHEDGLEFLGYVQLIDPLKSTAKRTINLARDLGVKVKILTGDSMEVARYIAEQVGLINSGDKVYTGDDLDQLTDIEMQDAVKNCVFARVTPEQKYRIIKILKQTEVVAYQGDGINDAPSLKLADVAIAVNTATDVAKESADILLLKADMGVVIRAISSGRATFANINKYIRYTMIGNFSSFFTLAAIYINSGTALPLLSIQLLVFSSFTQLPMIAIASDTVEDSELKQPRHYDIRGLIFISLFLGLITTVCQLIFYAIINHGAPNIIQSSLFIFLILVQIVAIFSMRNTSFFWRAKMPSKRLLLAVALACFVSILMLYIEPIKHWLGTVSLTWMMLGFIIITTIIYHIVLDLLKVLYYRLTEKVNI